MRFSLSLVSAAMLATLATAAPAPQANNNLEISSEAAPSEPIALEMGAEFQTFNWAADKSIDRTFTLNLDAPARLQITDYKLGGDAFEVLDNGEVIGITSEGANEEDMFAETPEEALDDERFSHATFVLGAGEHEISLNALDSANAEGSGAIRIVPQVNAFHKDYKKKGGDWDDDKKKKGGDWDDDDDDEWDDDKDDKWDDDDEWDDKDDDKWSGKDDKWGGKDDKWGGKDDKWDGKDDKWDGKDDKWDKDWDNKKTKYVYYTKPGTAVVPSDTTTTTITTTTFITEAEELTTPSTTLSPVPENEDLLSTSTVTSGTVTSTETVIPDDAVTTDATRYLMVSMPWLTI